jgi:hypothetical protein
MNGIKSKANNAIPKPNVLTKRPRFMRMQP